MYVYTKSKTQELWLVGFYRPDGKWEQDSEWNTPEKAAGRVSFLNGVTTRKPVKNPPIVSVGPSGIGGEYQKEIKSKEA